MPPKKNRKRNYKKKNSRKPKLLSIGPYFPPKIICRHKYQQVFAMSQSYNLNSLAQHNFRLNSMFDPDVETISTTQHQPRLFDEMNSFYDTYKVIGAKAYVKFINLSEEPAYIGTKVAQYQASTSDTTLNDFREMKGTKVNILHGLNSGPRSVVTHVRKYSPSKTEGISKREFNVRVKDFAAGTNTNPLTPHFLSTMITQVSDTLGSSENLNVQVELTIHYTTEWSGLRPVMEQS